MQLRASLSGKLVRYLVEDGAFVEAGKSYAEVEVMKMYMPLQIKEAGECVVHQFLILLGFFLPSSIR